MTFHPQRWTDNPLEWAKELVWQNFKNVIKKGMIRFAKDGFLRNLGWLVVFRPIRVLLFDRRHELLFLRYVMSLIH